MATGQIISLLLRYYMLSHKYGEIKDGEKYLSMSKLAVNIYINSQISGFTCKINSNELCKSNLLYSDLKRNVFVPIWFEEYPLSIPNHVLNGHIFSMIGLYDLAYYNNSMAQTLYWFSFKSTEFMINLYDGGSHTFYDLGHWTNNLTPNVARETYHNLHIKQLRFLNLTDQSYIFTKTLKRWEKY
ncbi:hypothetical protein A3Q56_08449 [Intoshia linei]|uniref:D-glucuronyl C5-epimerase C-terminal domain-containing protein n=1 Tax=Intoshia linei TaxID=1819745 RepID=A0A177APA6_9BILA|nr:hypothetical protein A3Q56_08449 [Intoshia linei]